MYLLFFKQIRYDEIMLKHAKANQHNYKSSMHEIKKDYPKNVKITKQRTRHY